MPAFTINFIAPIEVSAVEIVKADSAAQAESIVRQKHKQGRVNWVFKNSDVGGYVGRITQMWTIPEEGGRWVVSLIANILFSAVSNTVTANSAAQAQSIGNNLHAQGQLVWFMNGINLGPFTDRIDSLWASPVPPPSRVPTVSLSTVPPPGLNAVETSSFIYGTQGFIYAQINNNISGQLQFTADDIEYGWANIDSNGVAILDTTWVSPGSRTIKAIFPGNTSFVSAQSNSTVINVQKIVPSISLVIIPTSISAGQIMRMTSQISVLSPPSQPVPVTGRVTFFYRSPPFGSEIELGHGDVDEYGTTHFDTHRVPGGSWQIMAQYSGDKYNDTADSPQIAVSVSGFLP